MTPLDCVTQGRGNNGSDRAWSHGPWLSMYATKISISSLDPWPSSTTWLYNNIWQCLLKSMGRNTSATDRQAGTIVCKPCLFTNILNLASANENIIAHNTLRVFTRLRLVYSVEMLFGGRLFHQQTGLIQWEGNPWSPITRGAGRAGPRTVPADSV